MCEDFCMLLLYNLQSNDELAGSNIVEMMGVQTYRQIVEIYWATFLYFSFFSNVNYKAGRWVGILE